MLMIFRFSDSTKILQYTQSENFGLDKGNDRTLERTFHSRFR